MQNIIYGLVDPRSSQLRYIGRSANGLTRPSKHWTPSNLRKDKTHKANWIRAVLAEGLIPKVIVIELVAAPELLNDAERKWIRYWRKAGAPLTNGTEGGEGIVGWKHSEQSREKIRLAGIGRQISLEGRAQISKAQKGRAKSLETKAKISEALKGRASPKSAEACANISAAQKGRVFS